MKSAFDDIVGNYALRRKLQNDILGNKLSHAYVLEGQAGFGKHMLAMRIAAALACEAKDSPAHPLPCRECPSCKKILSGNSPDVIKINRGDKATLGVEVIRELRQDVYVAPNDVATKVYLIEDAHLMTPPAQNAFLLTLEEPPPYVLFLLLCENAASLLETVRSRAPILRLEPIEGKTIHSHLCQINREAQALQAENPRAFDEIIASANGSIGRALSLLDEKKRAPILEKRERAREFVRLCTSRRNTVATMRFFNTLNSKKRDELLDWFEILLLCLRDLLLCKQTEAAPLCFFYNQEEACSAAYDFTTPELLRLCDSICEASDHLRMNANVRLTLTGLAVQTGLLS